MINVYVTLSEDAAAEQASFSCHKEPHSHVLHLRKGGDKLVSVLVPCGLTAKQVQDIISCIADPSEVADFPAVFSDRFLMDLLVTDGVPS
jgi:hypothetical protein